MHLDKIEIQGFKSFAQKTILQFPAPQPGKDGDKGIACVVGPNGSGKSNIVDAIRWVLGEQSLKSLRGKKSEDVIFAGSENKTRLGMAYVAMHINNEDGRMPVDYKEVVISRKLYRNGDSEYMINKSKVRLQDVIMLLAKANFGQKSYSIVSQGSIDKIITASSADRKEYFDEAVGVRQFQIKRDQSLNKLETSWNNLRQVDALLTEIKPRLNSLERQVKRLEKREKVEKELKELSHSYYGFLWHELEVKSGAVKPELEIKEKELSVNSQALKQLQGSLRSLEKEDSRSKVFGDLQKSYQDVLSQKNKIKEEQLIMMNKMELAKQRLTDKASPLALSEIIAKLKSINVLEEKVFSNFDNKDIAITAQTKEDLRELGKLIKDLVGQLENPKVKEKVKAEIDQDLTNELAEINTDLEGLEKRLHQASTAIDEFNQTEEKKKGKFFDLQREITAKQDSYNKLANQVSEFRVELARLETRQQDLKQEIKDELGGMAWLENYQTNKIDEGDLHGQIQKLRRQLEIIGGVDPEIVKEHQEIKERHDFLFGQADDLRTAIEDLEKIINDLDEQIQGQFNLAFKNINKEFEHFFKILFGGGKAQLLLVKDDPKKEEDKKEDEETVAEHNEELGILDQLTKAEEQLSPKKFLKKRTGKVISGIDIVATPPGKKVTSINVLSGGERSLASIALICAVISNNPSPFVVLDEVDAALDEVNSQRFSKILTELSHKTQFIVITHNRSTMHQADVLYGVTMGDDGISRLISLKLEQAEKVVRQ